MTGSSWRLLAVFSLIFIASIFIASIVVTPAFLRGQDASADRSALRGPTIAPLIAPELSPIARSAFIAPLRSPPPILQRGSPAVPQRPIFPQLVRAAGIIFSGRVVFIGRAPSSAGQREASTAITFEVERALRGASPGKRLTIHEWAGLWSSGERYHVGEHVLLFLYSPSKLGLTSPVAGALGRFAVDDRGRIMMNAGQLETLAADPILGQQIGGKNVVPYTEFVHALRRSSGGE